MQPFYKRLLPVLCLFGTLTAYSQASDTVEIKRTESGIIRFVRFKPSNTRKFTDASDFLKTVLQAKPADEFRIIKSTTDKLGMTHQRYQQYYKGIKVEHAEYLVHNKNGMIETINGDFKDIKGSVIPTITEQNALTQALLFVKAKKYKWEDPALEEFIKRKTNNITATYFPKGELVVVKDLLKNSKSLKLAWKFTISSSLPSYEQWVYVDAMTGDVINNEPLIYDTNIACTASTRYSGSVGITGDTFSGGVRLRESRNGVSIVTQNLGGSSNYANATDLVNNTTAWNPGWAGINQDQVALDAHWGAEQVMDYWNTTFGRSSIDGNGMNVTSFIHTTLGNNASWDGTSNVMNYGDGDGTLFRPLVALDVCAHEFGHGICQYTANLAYVADESGALNEGFSDIWGACVEHFAAPGKQTWLIGEEVTISSPGYIRSLINPKSSLTNNGTVDTYHGTNWYSGSSVSTYTHTNMSVLSHWFYLVSEGGSGVNDNSNSFVVNSIGINEAETIAFRTESVYLNSSATFAATRDASIQSAIDLFGAGSCEEIAVTNAWYAVGVGGPYFTSTNSISGASAICSSENYTVNSLPSGVSVAWTVSPSGPTSSSTSGNTLTLTKNTDGFITLSAAASGCSVPVPIASRNLVVGIGVSGTYYVTSNYYTGSGSLNGTGGSVFTRGNQTVLFNGMLDQSVSLSNISWSVSGNYSLFYPSGYNFALYMTTPSSAYSANNATVSLNASGPCGTVNKSWNFQVVSTGSGFGYSMVASPNPSKNNLNVNIHEVVDTTKEQSMSLKSSSNTKGITKMYLYDFYTNALVKQWSFQEIDAKNYSLNIVGIKAGYYVLKMERDNKTTRTTIIVQE